MHDAAYKLVYSNPRMVADLLRVSRPGGWVYVLVLLEFQFGVDRRMALLHRWVTNRIFGRPNDVQRLCDIR